MKKHKQQKKRVKKYKGKYITANRLDMSKGGRVSYAKGQTVKDGLATTEMETNKKKTTLKKDGLGSLPPGVPVDQPDAGGGPITMQKDINVNGKGKGQNNNINLKTNNTGENYEDEPKDPPNGEYTKVINGFIHAWNGYTYVNTEQKANDTTNNTTDEETTPTDAQLQTQFESQRQARVLKTGTDAQSMAAGVMPEGMPTIPEPKRLVSETGEVAKGTEIAKEDVPQMGDTERGVAKDVGDVRAEQVKEGIADEADTTEVKGVVKAPTTTVSGTKVAVDAKTGTLSPESKASVEEIRQLSGNAVAAQVEDSIMNAAKATDVNGVLSAGAFAPEVTGAKVQLSPTADAEAKEREAITGTPATDGQAAQIIGIVGYEAAPQRAVKGQAAKGAAAEMIAEVGNMPPDIAAAIVEDPASVEAQVDTNPVEVNAAIAALPTEALVSSQMESLLGGMEDGNIPAWARPAVDAVNAGMAQRGLSVSTVGRDSLFNAIIQSAMPMAQSNAQALQTRAAQNLSNQQQANLQQATQEQQLRMQNLANRQDAASQTAQMSQQMKTMQSQFTQQAVMTTADQQQQMRMQNLQNRQQEVVTNAQLTQQANMANLGNEQQLNMAELQIEAQVEGANQAATNQQRMLEMQSAADFLSKNAGFKQQMELANLSNDQQMKLANLSALNQASSENLNAEQQTELANLNKQMQVNIKNGELAQSMGLAQLNVDQQRAMQNANVTANMDMANFNADQQRVLANSKFMQTVAITNMNAEQQLVMQQATALASLDMAAVDQRTKLAVSNAQNFLQMDMANLSNEQQASMMRSQQEQQRLLSDQSASNAQAQFNATSENQVNQFMSNLEQQNKQFNSSQLNAMEQFNVANTNAAEARRVGNEFEAEKLEAQLQTDMSKFNAQQDFAKEQFNTQNETVIAQSNVEWRRKANTADTAAFNAVNQQNAQNAFGLTASANNFLWQELRDEADFDFKRWDNEQQRKASLLIAALGNSEAVNKKDAWDDNVAGIARLLDGWLS